MNWPTPYIVVYIIVPTLFVVTILYAFFYKSKSTTADKKYKVVFKLQRGKFHIENIKRGVSIIGSAGSGKTESVVFNFLQHFAKYSFSGVIHDCKKRL